MLQHFTDIRFAIIRFKCLIACGFKATMIPANGGWDVTQD